jgi:hypothetical protein
MMGIGEVHGQQEHPLVGDATRTTRKRSLSRKTEGAGHPTECTRVNVGRGRRARPRSRGSRQMRGGARDIAGANRVRLRFERAQGGAEAAAAAQQVRVRGGDVSARHRRAGHRA